MLKNRVNQLLLKIKTSIQANKYKKYQISNANHLIQKFKICHAEKKKRALILARNFCLEIAQRPDFRLTERRSK